MHLALAPQHSGTGWNPEAGAKNGPCGSQLTELEQVF